MPGVEKGWTQIVLKALAPSTAIERNQEYALHILPNSFGCVTGITQGSSI